MRLLLDTHTFIWWDSAPNKLSLASAAALRDPANEVFLSVASVWEVVIKGQLGKLSLSLPLAEIVARQQTNGLQVLEVSLAHVLGVHTLSPVHKDLFDRLLAAQAVVEGMALVTADFVFGSYPVQVFW